MNNPKVILFQKDETALGYRYNLDNGFKLDPNISIKSIDYDIDEIKNNYTLIGEPELNSVFYRHPYKENTYVNENYNEIYFLKEKLSLFKEIGKQLGAKSIKTKIKKTKSKERNIDASGEVSYAKVKGDLSVNTEVKDNHSETIEINEKFELMPNFDLNKNIDELHKKINILNLHHETDLIELIRDRDSRNTGIALSEKQIKSEITSEYNSLTNISANLTAAATIFSLSANFKDTVKTENKIVIEIEYDFFDKNEILNK